MPPAIPSASESGIDPTGVWGQALGGALSIGGLIYKGIAARNQLKKANALRPIDPGFKENSGIIDNQRILNERFNNYVLPGKQNAINNINLNGQQAYQTAESGATSGGDLIDAATKISYGTNNAIGNLAVQEAQAKDNLLPQVLNANAMAGNELVKRNEFDNGRYQDMLNDKNALTQAGNINAFSLVDDVGTLGGSLLNYKTTPWSRNKGNVTPSGSIFN
jgi:hypothetical protein